MDLSRRSRDNSSCTVLYCTWWKPKCYWFKIGVRLNSRPSWPTYPLIGSLSMATFHFTTVRPPITLIPDGWGKYLSSLTIIIIICSLPLIPPPIQTYFYFDHQEILTGSSHPSSSIWFVDHTVQYYSRSKSGAGIDLRFLPVEYAPVFCLSLQTAWLLE